jgi:biopolymer transport protein ExbB/TolQ
MFMSANVIVKAVMLGLLFAWALTWTIWLVKTFELVSARRGLDRAQQALATARCSPENGEQREPACRAIASRSRRRIAPLAESSRLTNASSCASSASKPVSGGG